MTDDYCSFGKEVRLTKDADDEFVDFVWAYRTRVNPDNPRLRDVVELMGVGGESYLLQAPYELDFSA